VASTHKPEKGSNWANYWRNVPKFANVLPFGSFTNTEINSIVVQARRAGCERLLRMTVAEVFC
jgi:hypothetical protein